MQSNYSFKRKKYSNKYQAGDQLESVIVLRTNATLMDWTTAKDLERGKNEEAGAAQFVSRQQKALATGKLGDAPAVQLPPQAAAQGQAHMNKGHLMAKIPTTMTIINNNNLSNTALLMGTSTHSDDGKLSEDGNVSAPPAPPSGTVPQDVAHKTTRIIYNKALEAIQATGHHRGFIKSVYPLNVPILNNLQEVPTVFGVFCIRWRRVGVKEENESKFVITGFSIREPPLNIYCTIEEKMFVKMPMAFKVVLKNPINHVLHLIATLSISKSDNFICSGHKQVSGRSRYSPRLSLQFTPFSSLAGCVHHGLR